MPRQRDVMRADEQFVSQALKGGVSDLLQSEELVTDALRDLLRDELKRKMRDALDANPELRDELKEAVQAYFEAKVREYLASLKFAKASAKLGVTMLPDALRSEIGRDVGRFLEKELSALLEQSV